MSWRNWIILASIFFVPLLAVNGLEANTTTVFAQHVVVKDVTPEFPQPKGYVNDFARLLTSDQEKSLAKIAANFERRTTAQLAVVTIETISPFDAIEPYATKLFNTWGIGQKDKNNGVLLLVAVREHKVRIEVGRGLEHVLTNARCKEILQTKVTPRLKEGAYYEAINRALESIIKEIEK